jgi:hypothetical protein
MELEARAVEHLADTAASTSLNSVAVADNESIDVEQADVPPAEQSVRGTGAAARMRRLRERRRKGWTRVVTVEVSANDIVNLWERGFLATDDPMTVRLSLALQRLLKSIE